jgi:hypothetical protein
MKRHIALAAAAMMWAAPVAQAEVIDIATLKCADLAQLSADEITFVITWVDGYLGGRAEDTRLDTDRMGNNIDSAVAACKDDDQQSVLSVLKDAEQQNSGN